MEKADKNITQGLLIAGGMIIAIAGLFVLNYVVPLNIGPLPSDHFSTYTSRIWAWLEYSLGITGCYLVYINRKIILAQDIALAIILGMLNWIGRFQINRDCYDATPETIIIVIVYVAATVIFRSSSVYQDNFKIRAFEETIMQNGKEILIGIGLAIPLAAINIYYFWSVSGPSHPGSLLLSAITALHPGISEEIIFRYFIIAVCVAFLKNKLNSRVFKGYTLFISIIPHSMAHLPDTWLVSPGGAIFLLVATSLLFGLPMALLQIKRNLECAIGFHWFIDFSRFFLGF